MPFQSDSSPAEVPPRDDEPDRPPQGHGWCVIRYSAMGIVWRNKMAILPRTEMVQGLVRQRQGPYHNAHVEWSVLPKAKYLSGHQGIMGRMPPSLHQRRILPWKGK